LRTVGELDEVENLMEAGETHVVSPRHSRIETLEGREGTLSDERSEVFWRKPTRGEAKASTGMQVGLGEGEGQESIGLVAG
jgi:hypothetical protein